MGIPKRERAAAHIMHGSHVTYKSHSWNFCVISLGVIGLSDLRDAWHHWPSTTSIASISACLVACGRMFNVPKCQEHTICKYIKQNKTLLQIDDDSHQRET